jgi:hypothetical protein
MSVRTNPGRHMPSMSSMNERARARAVGVLVCLGAGPLTEVAAGCGAPVIHPAAVAGQCVVRGLGTQQVDGRR